ncbi:2,3-diaminopropionate biosynthesis protein SbnB [Pseudoalteromonas rubra]|uniref:2,3-diaminopropionate biosynthesis protein SbnB n=1 Tax=Pseudoalteromonas rubra TaxID=43658 RepID=A0A4Q7E4L0_9GAMM|nr:2,3-diaminopropionate biosynthesis protein SbnB [Pseudoalteromonas rubra]RZM76723.1 2,3-diaminopropionate biosynthesis protein SbnB [Pseudoalteromonas rubra]
MDKTKYDATQPATMKILGADLINRYLSGNFAALEQVIISTYQQHHSGGTINPDSYFLQYPQKPNRRIIALPAHVAGETNLSGIKWIASYPDNINVGLQRASASLILNDGDTGYPIAFMESSIISATRTVVSAAAGLHFLKGSREAGKVAIIGNGFIAKKMVESLVKLDWQVDQFLLFDLNPEYANSLRAYIDSLDANLKVSVMDTLEQAVCSSDVLITTTTAGKPYITDLSWLAHNPIVINLSLRDFSAEIILASNNVFDDVEHCLKANTSPHLAYMQSGNKEFVTGHFGHLIDGSIELDNNKPTIFSPFGLGVLDIALGNYVLQASNGDPEVTIVDNFFGDHSRW